MLAQKLKTKILVDGADPAETSKIKKLLGKDPGIIAREAWTRN